MYFLSTGVYSPYEPLVDDGDPFRAIGNTELHFYKKDYLALQLLIINQFCLSLALALIINFVTVNLQVPVVVFMG